MMIIAGQIEPGCLILALNHSDLDSRTKWIISSHKDFKEMNLCAFWKEITKSEMPDGCQSVKNK
jgi:hypothetical protein